MKKASAIFCTLGAFAGATSAQSTVTLFGLIDLSYQSLKSGANSPLGGASLSRLSDGSAYGPQSRWGVRAIEDLGAGLKATAWLESGLAADTGALGNGGRSFGRQAFVALASDRVGEVRLGRQYALHDEVTVLNNPFGNSTVLNPGAAANTLTTGAISLFIDAPRIDNMLQYISPTFGGFKVQTAVALGEGMVDRYQGLKGVYGNGPLNVAMSYEWSKARVGTAGVSAPGDSVNKILNLGANYNFNAFKVFGGVQRSTDLTTGSTGIITAPATAAAGGIGSQIATLTLPGLAGPATQLTSYTVGAAVPIGAAIVGANYSRARFENAGGADRTLGRIGVAATYSLSKLTLLYTGVAVHNGDLKNFINEKRIFQVGLKKAF